jgi:hypothetical protein
MTPKDLSAAVRAQNILNSMIKRGEIDGSRFKHTDYIVCGCGEEGCGFISSLKPQDYEDNF